MNSKHIQLATQVSNQSYANILLSANALPRNANHLEDLAKDFDEDDNRFGAYVVEIRDYLDQPHLSRPLCVMVGGYQTVVRAALCLAPVAELIYEMKNKRRGGPSNYIHIIKVPTSFDFLEGLHRDDGQYMSFLEFSNSRTPVDTNVLLSEYTGDDADNEDHIKGFLYGEEHHKILITECDHTDICAVKYDELYFGEEDQDEAEAVAYRCYLNSKGFYADATLRDHFSRPLGKRRASLTY